MTLAYVTATIVLLGAIAFSYYNLRSILIETTSLNQLAASTAELRLAIRDSASHLAELKVYRVDVAPDSQLQKKIQQRLKEALIRIEKLQIETQHKAVTLSSAQFKDEMGDVFTNASNDLWIQLDNYRVRLHELTDTNSTNPYNSNKTWLPVEATSAEKGLLSISFQTALAHIQSLVSSRLSLLDSRHKGLTFLSALLLLLEALLIYIPLNRMFRRVHTKMQTAHDKLYQQANFDVVTGLANTTGIEALIASSQTAVNNKSSVIVRVRNIDEIRNIIGPDFLSSFSQQFAKRMIKAMPGNADVFRSGDAEFGAIFDSSAGSDDSNAEPFRRDLLSQKMVVGASMVYPIISMGIATGPLTADTLNSNLSDARLAQQAYEGESKPIPVFEQTMRARIEGEHALVEEIRQALNNREFIPFYQIKVDSISGSPSSMEALCRWKRSDGTIVSPGYFIPAAESSGLITELSWQLLEKVCEDWNTWNDLGLKTGRVAFNVAETLLLESDFLEKLKRLVDSLNANSCPLELEVTENITLADQEATIKTILQSVRSMGLNVALDDFGTGHASLVSLKSLDIDTVKIDQSFVREMSTNDTSHTLVVSLINLCRMLKLHCVVEGVETKQQWDICAEAGCDEIQGYYFFEPHPRDEITRILSDHQPFRWVG